MCWWRLSRKKRMKRKWLTVGNSSSCWPCTWIPVLPDQIDVPGRMMRSIRSTCFGSWQKPLDWAGWRRKWTAAAPTVASKTSTTSMTPAQSLIWTALDSNKFIFSISFKIFFPRYFNGLLLSFEPRKNEFIFTVFRWGRLGRRHRRIGSLQPVGPIGIDGGGASGGGAREGRRGRGGGEWILHAEAGPQRRCPVIVDGR